jgi:hypothetical protein
MLSDTIVTDALENPLLDCTEEFGLHDWIDRANLA